MAAYRPLDTMFGQNLVSRQGANVQRHLPLVHVTSFSRFERIVQANHLKPRLCSIMKREVLYCSYGDFVHRASKEEKTTWESDLPVVLIIAPAALGLSYQFFPLDTGAVCSGRVRWLPGAHRSNLKSLFSVQDRHGTRLKAWVNSVFGDDERYINRQPVYTPTVVPDQLHIVRGLCAGVTDSSSPAHLRDDMRVISQIECQFFSPIGLEEYVTGIYVSASLAGYTEVLLGQSVLRSRVRVYCDAPVKYGLPPDLVRMTNQQIVSYLPSNYQIGDDALAVLSGSGPRKRREKVDGVK